MFIRIPKFAVEILSANAFEDNGREKPTFLTTQSQFRFTVRFIFTSM